jgi:molecular chaperone DnaK (HSP70)
MPTEEEPGATISPYEVITAIITYLGEVAERYLDYPICGIVITLPHALMKIQSELKDAIEQANPWNVTLIEDSEAAARTYRYDLMFPSTDKRL